MNGIIREKIKGFDKNIKNFINIFIKIMVFMIFFFFRIVICLCLMVCDEIDFLGSCEIL